MDGFGLVDPENRGRKRGFGSMKEEGGGGGGGGASSLCLGRKRLSDITNTHFKSQEEKLTTRPSYSFATKEYIEKIQKENITLRQLLQESTHVIQERNKVIEFTALELSKLRINLQKLQQQNRLLAQANTHMTMERTLDKDRMRVMQHELGCRGALLAAKNMEFQVEVKKKRRQKPYTFKKPEEATVAVGGGVTTNDTSQEINEECMPDAHGDAKTNRSRRSRIQSSGSSVAKEQVIAKEKPQNKRKSAGVKSEQREPTAVISDNKRSCLRRQSARFNSDSVEPTKVFCEIEDAGNPTSMLLETNMQEGALEVHVEDKEKTDKESDQVEGVHVQAHVADDEAHKFRRSLRSRTQSLGSLDVKEQQTTNENPEGKRKSTVIKSEGRESTDDQSDSKRLHSKRQSACSRGEDVFKTEDARVPIASLSDNCIPVLTNSPAEEVKEPKTDWNRDTPGLRISLGRPSRAAAGKVQSYKEIPLNIKMRRSE